MVTSGSTSMVTPAGRTMGWMMKAFAVPLAENSTAWPTGQALRAFWMRVVSGEVSTRLPLVWTAVRTVQTGG